MKKQTLINKLLYKYRNILKECIAQRKSFNSEMEFLKVTTKFQGYINTIQTIQLRQYV